MNSGGPERLWLIAACVGVPLFILLLIGVFMELGDRRREAQARYTDIERTGGWRASADALLILILGGGVGWVCAYLLSEAVIRFVTAQVTTGAGTAALEAYLRASPFNLAAVLLALVLLLAVGPLSAYSLGRRSPVASLFAAALCGAAAFSMLAAMLFESAAATFASQELIDLGLSSAPYNEIDWVAHLGLGIQSAMLWVVVSFAGFVMLGAAVAGLLGALTAAHDPRRRPIHWASALAVTGTPLLALLIMINVVIFVLLGDALRSMLAHTGLVAGYGANDVLTQVISLPLAALGLLQILALVSAEKAALPANQAWMVSFGLALMGLLDVAAPALLLPAFPLRLPALVLGLLLLAGAVRLARQTPSERVDERPTGRALLPHWAIAGLGSGLLTGLIAQLSVVVAVFIVLFDVNIIPDLAKLRSPAVTPAWVEEQLRITFQSNFTFSYSVVLAYLVVGGLVGLFCQWLQSNLLLPLMWVSLARIGQNGVRKGFKVFLAVLGGLVLGWLTGQVDRVSVPLLALLTGLLALALLYPRLPLRWPRWSAILIFLLAGAGMIGLSIHELWTLPISPLLPRAVYALLVGPCLGCAAGLFLSVFRPGSRPVAQVIVLLLLALGLMLNSTEDNLPPNTHGQVVAYDGSRWQAVDLSSVQHIGDWVNYYFYSDRQGRLWLTSQSGLFLRQAGSSWQPYLLTDPNGSADDSPLARSFNQQMPPFITENEDGTFWVVAGSAPGLFNPADPEHLFTAPNHKTGRLGEEGEAIVEYVPVKDLVMGMDLDPSGGIWLATLNSGVVQVTGGRPLEDAQWQTYNIENGLRDSSTYAILAGQDGSVWVGSLAGLERYRQGQWQPVLDPAMPEGQSVYSLLEDRRGQVWAGAQAGGARFDGQRWQPFSADPGWPGAFEIHHLYQDPAGRIWAIGPDGALRFDGQRWVTITRGHSLIAFTGLADGSAWLGGEDGLLRVAANDSQEWFDAQAIGFPFDGVVDLHVDARGQLWASLSRSEQPPLNGALAQVITGSLFVLGLGVVLLRKIPANGDQFI